MPNWPPARLMSRRNATAVPLSVQVSEWLLSSVPEYTLEGTGIVHWRWTWPVATE